MLVKKIYVTTAPFDANNPLISNNLQKLGFEFVLNPHKRKMTLSEISSFLPRNLEFLIAGTENYTEEFLSEFRELKVISRVGIGIDNIPLKYCKREKIEVFNTPSAPSEAVAQLTLQLILMGIRGTFISNFKIKKGIWERRLGEDLRDTNIGIVGYGRIGKRVSDILTAGFGITPFVHDIDDDLNFSKVQRINLEELFKRSDVISLHLPLTSKSNNLISLPNDLGVVP